MMTTPSGLEAIQWEMRRMHADAQRTLESNRAVALEVARAARDTGRLWLLGMGASHYANRAAEVEYRRLGLEAHATTLSEALYNRMPDRPRATVIASQSGASGEAVRYLETPAGSERRFGLTLDPDSPVGRVPHSLIGHGGVEVGFAATRSLLLTLTLHACVLEALGEPQAALRLVLEDPPEPDIAAALEAVRGADALVFSGRSSLTGIAETVALNVIELARIPTLALEGGQFRHGPLELLRPGIGVILLRAGGATAELSAANARTCLEVGITPVVFDASGLEPVSVTPTQRGRR